jgi:hypothetical protein
LRLNPIIPEALGRSEDNGLPQCNLQSALPPRSDRRVLLAGGIDCPRDGAGVTGNDTDVPIVAYYRLFQLAPVTQEFGVPPVFDLHVEVIERLEANEVGPYREVVQLFR